MHQRIFKEIIQNSSKPTFQKQLLFHQGFTCHWFQFQIFQAFTYKQNSVYADTHRGRDENSSLTKLYVRKDKAAVILLSYGKLSNKSKREISGAQGLHRKQFLQYLVSVSLADGANKLSKELCYWSSILNRYKYTFLPCIYFLLFKLDPWL